MINFLSRKNLLALLLALTCVGPQVAWGMRARSGSVGDLSVTSKPAIRPMEDGDMPIKLVRIDDKVVDTITKEPVDYFKDEFLAALNTNQVVSYIEKGIERSRFTKTETGWFEQDFDVDGNEIKEHAKNVVFPEAPAPAHAALQPSLAVVVTENPAEEHVANPLGPRDDSALGSDGKLEEAGDMGLDDALNMDPSAEDVSAKDTEQAESDDEKDVQEELTHEEAAHREEIRSNKAQKKAAAEQGEEDALLAIAGALSPEAEEAACTEAKAQKALKIKKGRLSTAEVSTATGRMIAITVTQHMKNKFGKDSKKALIAEVFANVLRIANDLTMLSNERVNDRKNLLNWTTLSCSAIDACNIAVNAKKLAKKEFANKQIDDEPKQVSKLINFINSYVPYIEGLAALVRSGAKTEKLGNHTDIAYGCTLFITFARAAEFYATAEDSKSIKALAFGVAAVAVLTTIWDLIPSKKDKAVA